MMYSLAWYRPYGHLGLHHALAGSARRKAGSSKRMATNGVASYPRPSRSTSLRSGRSAGLEKGVIVIAAGGGGIPTMYKRGADRQLIGVEAVIDKDLASELLARDLNADLFIMATDATAV